MPAFARVLLPLDGSSRAEAALVWAGRVPAEHIRLLRVCPPGEAHAVDATRYLESVAVRCHWPGCTVDVRVVHGEPAEQIVLEAADADLIVMSTEGAGAGGRLIFGSVADRVARHAPAPAFLVRGGSDPVSAVPVRRIVVPLDGSAAAERALPIAIRLARAMETGVLLVTVDEAELGQEAAGQASPDAAEEAAASLARAATTLEEASIAAASDVRAGSPVAELLETVAAGDLLVMTTHGRGTARRWQIGGVAEKLLRQAAAPVVLVRTDAAESPSSRP